MCSCLTVKCLHHAQDSSITNLPLRERHGVLKSVVRPAPAGGYPLGATAPYHVTLAWSILAFPGIFPLCFSNFADARTLNPKPSFCTSAHATEPHAACHRSRHSECAGRLKVHIECRCRGPDPA